MAGPYFFKLTATGLALLLAAEVGAPVQLAFMAVGDANGVDYAPTGAEVALENERARVAIEAIAIDPLNPEQLLITAVVPAATGGFTIREIGVFTQAGDLFGIGNWPDTYKATIEDGWSADFVPTVICAVGAAANVTVVADASTIFATRAWAWANQGFFAVLSASLVAPPAAPATGDHYLIPAAATGAWAGQGSRIAIWQGAPYGWLYADAPTGSMAQAADTRGLKRKTLTGWRPATATPGEHLDGAPGLLATASGARTLANLATRNALNRGAVNAAFAAQLSL
jgi:hypothetical protein